MLAADWSDLDVALQQYTPYIMPLDYTVTADVGEAARAAEVILPRSGVSLTMKYPTHSRLATTALAAARDCVAAALQRFEAALFSPPSDKWRTQVGGHVDEGSFIDYLLLQVRLNAQCPCPLHQYAPRSAPFRRRGVCVCETATEAVFAGGVEEPRRVPTVDVSILHGWRARAAQHGSSMGHGPEPGLSSSGNVHGRRRHRAAHTLPLARRVDVCVPGEWCECCCVRHRSEHPPRTY